MTVASVSRPVVWCDVLKDDRHRRAAAARDLADWLSRLNVENKADRTVDAYERTVAFLLRCYPEKTVGEFTDGDILHVLRAFPAKARHVRRSQLNQFFAYLELTGRIDRSPMRLVPRIRPPQHEYKPTFSEAEVAALEKLPAPDGPLMAVLFRTGIRLGEARRLQARDVDFEHQRILILRGKGNRDRVIHIRGLLSILAEWFTLDGIQPEDFLWYTTPSPMRILRRKSPVSEGRFYLWFKDCLDRAGVDAGVGKRKRTVHSTRHTYAQNWARKGGKPERLQREMGHSSIKTTMGYYVDVLTEDLLDDLELVGL